MLVVNIVSISISLIVNVFNLVSPQHMEGRVVDGQVAKMEDFPHAAFLFIECNEYTRKFTYFACGSSILNQAILITAAHCLAHCDIEITYITAYVGNIVREEGLKYLAAGFKMHKNYDPREICNDIGLVKLKKPLKFGPNVRRVTLMRDPPYDEPAEVAGWGRLREDVKTISDVLMQASQEVWSRSSCMQTLGLIPEGTICGGALDAESYIALGDSGSGLMVRKYILIGIASYKLYKKTTRLAIYTDVAYFYNWIKKTAKKVYCRKHWDRK